MTTSQTLVTYTVQQDRTIGHRDGELIINENGIEYRAKKRENENRRWTYNGDIKLLEILSPTKIRIWTYKDRKLLLGKDESVTFKIVEGQIDQNVSHFLRERIARPFVTSFAEEDQNALAQIPLRIYPDRVLRAWGCDSQGLPQNMHTKRLCRVDRLPVSPNLGDSSNGCSKFLSSSR